MIFICYIWSNFIISLIVDTNWWKNFGLSLLGSVGVPLTIWLLTRYYGADKAEERKELKELRNNLNLLLSLLYSNIEKMSILREHLLCVIDIERRNNIRIWHDNNIWFQFSKITPKIIPANHQVRYSPRLLHSFYRLGTNTGCIPGNRQIPNSRDT